MASTFTTPARAKGRALAQLISLRERYRTRRFGDFPTDLGPLKDIFAHYGGRDRRTGSQKPTFSAATGLTTRRVGGIGHRPPTGIVENDEPVVAP